MAESVPGRLVEVVLRFYAAENARDWDGVAAAVHPQIRSTTWPSGETVVGAAAYVAAMREMYRERVATFEVLSIAEDASADTVLAELVIEGKRSVNVFHLQGGMIHREREYLGEGYSNGDG